jgi:hypothetical protein
MQQHRVDCQEDRCVGADRECQGEYSNNAEAGTLPELTRGEANVLSHAISFWLPAMAVRTDSHNVNTAPLGVESMGTNFNPIRRRRADAAANGATGE